MSDNKYLHGTFGGNKTSITINGDTPSKDVEAFIKANPEIGKRITDSERISEQQAIFAKAKAGKKSK